MTGLRSENNARDGLEDCGIEDDVAPKVGRALHVLTEDVPCKLGAGATDKFPKVEPRFSSSRCIVNACKS